MDRGRVKVSIPERSELIPFCSGISRYIPDQESLILDDSARGSSGE